MWNAQQKQLALVLGCLLLVYFSWGTGFIAIHFGLQSFPAFLLCALRMTIAGFLLYVLTWLKGERNSPTLADFKQTFILAVFMVLISSGFLLKGQEYVDSGTAAMILGSVPVFMVLIGWLFFGEKKPNNRQFVGLGGGFVGLTVLTVHQGASGGQSPFGLALVFGAALAWVLGSFYSKKHAGDTKLSVMRNSGILMMIGGLQALVMALIFGELNDFSFHDVTLTSWGALVFLVFFGAITAYTCYFWLLLHTRTIVAISYEFVNPVIGVFLGWLMAGERVDGVIIMACCVMVGAVFLAVSGEHS